MSTHVPIRRTTKRHSSGRGNRRNRVRQARKANAASQVCAEQRVHAERVEYEVRVVPLVQLGRLDQ
jgi:hypothetical protein